jgi:hypothetical protein
MADDDVYALFIDVMGFADSVARLTPEQHHRVVTILASDGELTPDLPRPVLELVGSYRFFHTSLAMSISEDEDIRAILTFSDSAFVVATSFARVESTAWSMMRSCFAKYIPLRLGIGRGTFARLTFSHSSHPFGTLAAHVPFLGSSIVNAHRAERSESASGFRILVHPSAQQAIVPGTLVMNLSKAEQSESCAQEIRFVTSDIADQQQFLTMGGSEPHLNHLSAMRKDVKHKPALRHYDATEAAMKRQYKTLQKSIREKHRGGGE